MLNTRLILQVILIFLTGCLLLIAGTPNFVAGLILPLEREVQSLQMAAEGLITEKSTVAVNTISQKASDADVAKFFAQKWRSENPPEPKRAKRYAVPIRKITPNPELVKKALSKGNKTLGRPDFGLAVDANGDTLVAIGKKVGLPKNIMGFPPIRDALRGLVRDGLHVYKNEVMLVSAAPVYLGKKIHGAILTGWDLGEDFLGEISFKLHAHSVLLVEGVKKGKALDDVRMDDLPQPGTIKSFGDFHSILPFPYALPLFVEDNSRYIGVSVPLFKNDMRTNLVMALDRVGPFETISFLQLAIIGSTVALALMILLLSISLRKAWEKPMQLIQNHLSAYQQQGIAAGILPESEMKGPYLRLAKQLNMILSQGGMGRTFSNPSMPAVSVEGASEQTSESFSGGEPFAGLENEGSYPDQENFAPLSLDPKEEIEEASSASDGFSETSVKESVLSELFGSKGDITRAQALGDVPRAISGEDQAVTADSTDQDDPDETTLVTGPNGATAGGTYEDMCHSVFTQFKDTRASCGEDTSRLTFERFKKKLDKNRAAILDRYQCKDVRFEVYVKAGKAAIRAIPVKG